ncbi:MAG TPA: MBOAT family O-acyltransferase [Gemmatimonadaceae bacterium]|jgi:D-alanyl-lipoteichoic acid acyltransferase DltB (MBOAT superfamily)
MLFNSFTFLIFFPVVVAVYFAIPHRFRWAWLLGASCYFYMAFIPVYILILFFLISVDYAAGLLIEPATGAKRRMWLIMSLVANIGILAVFKYFNFLNANVHAIAEVFHWPYGMPMLSLVLPIGLSFHTFQAMSYTIEVYRGRVKAERHVGIYALYVMFFPQLVAGPIERPQNLIPQFYQPHEFDYERVTNGLRRMAGGLFMKVVIADRLARYVNIVYTDPSSFHGLTLVVATIFFAFQIYCDFAGYSHIAIGAAQVMGFRLMENFNHPYLSQSISEFWSRWHISLSTWFRDYVYIPLGGNRVRKLRWYYNLFVTFLLSGLWHGANWTYVIWGGLNGFYLISSLITAPIRERLAIVAGLSQRPRFHSVVRVATTFALVCIAWVFFRANTLQDVITIFTQLWARPTLHQLIPFPLRGEGITKLEVAYSFLLIAGLVTYEVFAGRLGLSRKFRLQPVWVRWPAYYAFCMAIWLLGISTEAKAFIYFQF